MNEIVVGILMALFSAIVVWIIKGFFTNLEKRVDKSEEAHEKRIVAIEARIENLNNKYGEVFNELIKKFSNWEDRIKGIMDELIKKEISGGAIVASEYVEIAMKDFTELATKDIEELRESLKGLDSHVSVLQDVAVKTHQELKQDSQQNLSVIKSTIWEIRQDINNMDSVTTKTLAAHIEKINTLHMVCKTLNTEHKRINDLLAQHLKESIQKINFKG